MWYVISCCRMVHVKEPLLLIGNSSCTSGCSWFPLSLSDWFSVVCRTQIVCMYVCVYICMYVCLYICVYVFMCVCMCFYVHICVYVCMYVCMHVERERNVLFNDALNTFYLRLYGVRHMVKDHSDSEKGNPLPPHRLLFPISSKGSFICTIPQTG